MDFHARQARGPESDGSYRGHKIPENPDDPRIIGETRKYLRDFIALDQATTTARQLYDAMLDLYPDRVNPGSLWGGANAAKKQTQS